MYHGRYVGRRNSYDIDKNYHDVFYFTYITISNLRQLLEHFNIHPNQLNTYLLCSISTSGLSSANPMYAHPWCKLNLTYLLSKGIVLAERLVHDDPRMPLLCLNEPVIVILRLLWLLVELCGCCCAATEVRLRYNKLHFAFECVCVCVYYAFVLCEGMCLVASKEKEGQLENFKESFAHSRALLQ